MKFPPITTARLEYVFFVPFVPFLSLFLFLSLFPFFPSPFYRLRSSIVYHTHTDGHAQADQGKWVEMFSNQSRSRIISLPIGEKSKHPRVLLFKKWFLMLKFFECHDSYENSMHFRDVTILCNAMKIRNYHGSFKILLINFKKSVSEK